MQSHTRRRQQKYKIKIIGDAVECPPEVNRRRPFRPWDNTKTGKIKINKSQGVDWNEENTKRESHFCNQNGCGVLLDRVRLVVVIYRATNSKKTRKSRSVYHDHKQSGKNTKSNGQMGLRK